MVTPYIVFAGRCREALAFYAAAFGGEARMIQPYGSYVPEGVRNPPDDLAEWVMHAEMEICGTHFWFADEIAQPVSTGNNVKLTATVATAQIAQGIWAVLSQGAFITLPPTDTFYSTFHAGLVDRFGVSWNLVAEEAPAQG